MDEIEVPQELRDSIDTLARRDKARVVLYVDPTMQHGENFLPTLNVEGDDGYYRVPEQFRAAVAQFFGPDYRVAKRRVDEVNETLGVPRDEAREIVIGVMFRGGAK